MMLPSLHNLMPSWGLRPTWQKAKRSIDIHIHRYCTKLGLAADIAREIRSRLASNFPVLTQFISHRLCQREFKRFYRYYEGILHSTNLNDTGGL